MISSPKYKVCRRLGTGVFEKCQTPKFAQSEERYFKNKKRGKRRRQVSDYGLQLLEKQKMRFTYGVSEKQFSNYVKEATSKHGVVPTDHLYQQLEARLDNVVYRLGLAGSRPFARQLVSHGHIAVNGKRVTIPSFHVRPGEKITIRDRSKAKPVFSEIADQLAKHKTVAWIHMDPQSLEGEMKSKPELKKEDVGFDITAVIEFYSR